MMMSYWNWWWDWLDATCFPMPQPSLREQEESALIGQMVSRNNRIIDEQLLNNPANAHMDWRDE